MKRIGIYVASSVLVCLGLAVAVRGHTTAITDGNGIASGALTLIQNPATVTATATFASTATFAGSTDSKPFVITAQSVQVGPLADQPLYTGLTSSGRPARAAVRPRCT